MKREEFRLKQHCCGGAWWIFEKGLSRLTLDDWQTLSEMRPTVGSVGFDPAASSSVANTWVEWAREEAYLQSQKGCSSSSVSKRQKMIVIETRTQFALEQMPLCATKMALSEEWMECPSTASFLTKKLRRVNLALPGLGTENSVWTILPKGREQRETQPWEVEGGWLSLHAFPAAPVKNKNVKLMSRGDDRRGCNNEGRMEPLHNVSSQRKRGCLL